MYERLKTLVATITGRNDQRRTAHSLYVAAAEASRRPAFYTELAVPDTVEGRYDLLSLHTILLIRRLRAEGEEQFGLAQLLFDVMFRDVDDNLREMGVGDLRVGKKVREYAEAFFGRAKVYEEALSGEGDLRDALSRNVYDVHEHPSAEELADYVRRAAAFLSEQDIVELERGAVFFPPVLNSAAEEVTHAAQ
jgi:cytochrome b pre-mRNA-processing protein 3